LIQAQEPVHLRGEVCFPFIIQPSAYGLGNKTAKKVIRFYERSYEKAKKENTLDYEMRLFALVKDRGLLFNPYVILSDSLGDDYIVYMDSASYAKTFLWNYTQEELRANQSYLLVKAKGNHLGENAYWLTEFNQITLIQDTTRSKTASKFEMGVYRK
jgi:hypothetical protein